MKWFSAHNFEHQLKQIQLNQKAREQEFVDEVAVKVLVAVIERSRKWEKEWAPDALAAWSYQVAREMLNEREAKP